MQSGTLDAKRLDAGSRTIRKIVSAIMTILFLSVFISGCAGSAVNQTGEPVMFTSFRDIPGVTAEEIAAIEALQRQYEQGLFEYFIYGMTLGTEAFIKDNGDIGGYSVLLCEWLTELFGIQFRPRLFSLSVLLQQLDSFDIDFFGNMMRTGEYYQRYFTTDTISERRFVTMRLAGSHCLNEISLVRPLRYAFLADSPIQDIVASMLERGTYEIVWMINNTEAHQALINGDVDVFVTTSAAEAYFIYHFNVIMEDFLPLVFNPVSMATANPALAPIISVVNRALRNGAAAHLGYLNTKGYWDFLSHRLALLFTEEEFNYIQSHPEVPIVTSAVNYPLSFLNRRSGEWQGIFIDLLDEVSLLTGLTFKIINDENIDWPRTQELLLSGQAAIIPELSWSRDRVGKFLWSNTVIKNDYIALISRLDYRCVTLNDITHIRTGVARDTWFTGTFMRWFPYHTNLVEYENIDAAFTALRNGEVDLVLSTQRRLMFLTHLQELADYKANFVFNQPIETRFGFNIEEEVLRSIIDKSLSIIDKSSIVDSWMRRTFDHRAKMAEAQRPWFIGAITLSLLVLALTLILFYRSRRVGKYFKNLVKERTHELELQTATLSAIFDSSADLIFCKDLDLRYTRCNKSTGDFLNIHPEDIIGKFDTELFAERPDVVQELSIEDKRVISEKQPIVFETKLKTGDNKEMLLETIKSPLMQNGKVIGLMAIARNITERRKTEDALAQQTAMLTTLIDSIPDLIFTKDLNLCFTQCNESFAQHFGQSKEFFIGKTNAESLGLNAEITEEFDKSDREVINENRTFVLEEYIPGANGVNKLYETINTPLLLNDSVTGILIIARDITKRKEMERKLASNYEYSNKLSNTLTNITKSPAVFAGILSDAADIITQEGCFALNTCRVGIWYLAKNGEFLRNFSCYSSYTKDHFIQDDFDLVHRQLYAKTLKSERLIVTNNAKEEMYDIMIDGYGDDLVAMLDAPIQVDGKLAGVVCVEQDRTEEYLEKREWTIEEQNFASSLADIMAVAMYCSERRKAHDDAERASKIKSTFLANMSHEIRTPMNSIVGFSELALDGKTSPKTRDYLGKIIENADGLLQIISDVLDFSKVEAGRMELENIPFDLHELFISCRMIIMPKAEEKGIKLHFYAEPSIEKKLLGDPTRLRQVLLNLLSNAVKFTHTGIVKLKAAVTGLSNDNIKLYFEVKDSGIGMTAEQIEKIFEPFAQAEAGTTRKYGGTGLGLTITKKILEIMGGTLSVESTLGVGSKFSFDLELKTTDAPQEKYNKHKVVHSGFEKPTFDAEVLLCEDNVMNQEVIREHLTRVGIKTVLAENGKIGVDIVQSRKEKKEKQFDLIFMDIHMPVMDGIEAAEKILALDTGVPIVALTANIMSTDMEIYMASGMKDCVGKPFTSQELWHCLTKYLKPIVQQKLDTQSAQGSIEEREF